MLMLIDRTVELKREAVTYFHKKTLKQFLTFFDSNVAEKVCEVENGSNTSSKYIFVLKRSWAEVLQYKAG